VIGLVLSMLRARPATALTLALLAMFATAAGVAGPAYLDSVDRAVVDQEVAGATTEQLSIAVTGMSDRTSAQAVGLAVGAVAPTLVDLPGFTIVSAVEVNVLGLPAPGSAAARLVSRPDACAHLVILSGRCAAGVSEVLVGERTAQRLELHAGDLVTLTYAASDPSRLGSGFVPGGAPAPFTVTGIYRPRRVVEAYWGRHGYFAPTPAGPADEPAFTTPAGLAALDHRLEEADVDAFAGPAAFTPDRLPALRARVAEITGGDLGLGVRVSTDLPGLLDRIDRGRQLAHQLVPVAAVPLVVLAWFVIFLAVRYATEARRPELGLVALRGARIPVR
jgi:putative ABC transport system permease protein